MPGHALSDCPLPSGENEFKPMSFWSFLSLWSLSVGNRQRPTLPAAVLVFSVGLTNPKELFCLNGFSLASFDWTLCR